MVMQPEKKRLTYELGDGTVIIVDVQDVQPVLSVTTLPKPPPKVRARMVVGVGDHPEGGPPPLELECTITLQPPPEQAA
ncbi:MAG: hypothetical protein U0T03_11865 [Xanthomonadales bacterium]|nr:hypothetical protein [Xanthomonadales bacterium]